jgi:hypothetical protein
VVKEEDKMKKFSMIVLIAAIAQFTGCIVFHSVSYEVNVNDDGTGSVLLKIDDLNTDGTTEETIQEDVNSIFQYGLKSQEWLDGMQAEGKQVTSRNLVVENGKLNAIVSYEFKDVSVVEGMQFDDPYYYITIPPEDSIISTNGQINRTQEYQRIIWDKSIKTLKFKMFSDNTGRDGLKSLAPYFLKEK